MVLHTDILFTRLQRQIEFINEHAVSLLLNPKGGGEHSDLCVNSRFPLRS